MDSLITRARRKAASARRYVRYQQALLKIPSRKIDTRINLAIITGELEVGGVGRVLLNLIDALPKKRFRVFVFTTDPRINSWAAEFRQHSEEVIDIPARLGGNQPQSRVEAYLRTYLAKHRMDILFITNSTAAYETLPAIKAAGKSAAAVVYDLLHTYGRPGDNDAFLKISMPYDVYIDKRIVIGEYLKRYYCEHYPVRADKVTVIYNGLGADVLRKRANSGTGKSFLKLRPGEQAITYLGRLQSDKSPDRLVELAYILKEDLDKHKMIFAIVGEGELQETLQARAKELGVLDKQVGFYPFTDKPLDVAAASRFTILTSDLEGIPMSALESMLVDTPMIAPAVGGLPEIIEDGVDGYLATFQDGASEQQKLAALATAVRSAIVQSQESHEAMCEQAERKVRQRFSKMGQTYLALFEVDLRMRGR